MALAEFFREQWSECKTLWSQRQTEDLATGVMADLEAEFGELVVDADFRIQDIAVDAGWPYSASNHYALLPSEIEARAEARRKAELQGVSLETAVAHMSLTTKQRADIQAQQEKARELRVADREEKMRQFERQAEERREQRVRAETSSLFDSLQEAGAFN